MNIFILHLSCGWQLCKPDHLALDHYESLHSASDLVPECFCEADRLVAVYNETIAEEKAKGEVILQEMVDEGRAEAEKVFQEMVAKGREEGEKQYQVQQINCF